MLGILRDNRHLFSGEHIDKKSCHINFFHHVFYLANERNAKRYDLILGNRHPLQIDGESGSNVSGWLTVKIIKK